MRVFDASGEVVDGERLEVRFDADVDLETEVEAADDDDMARVNIAVKLPDVSGRLSPGLYSWRVVFEDLEGRVPFIVMREPAAKGLRESL